MRFDTRRITPFSRFTAAPEHAAQDGGIKVLLCAAGSTVTVPAGFTGLWWALRGEMLALSGEFRTVVSRRDCLVGDYQRPLDVSLRTTTEAVAIVGPVKSWSMLLARYCGRRNVEPPLFPAIHRINLAALKNLFGVLRGLLQREHGTLTPIEQHALAGIACDLQREFDPLIARSPGQSASRKRAAFLRLQRIRNLISSESQLPFDLRAMASNANYSVYHFIRIYDAVFGETPYAHLSRCRVDRARRLLRGGEHGVGDVALAVGFESRQALARAVKKQVGVAPSRLLGIATASRVEDLA